MKPANNPVILPAYVDEAGARGLVRDLKPERDHEFGLMCAVLFDPDGHAGAIRAFTSPFEAFRNAMPDGAKLHITDAFKPGNEAWRAVAEPVREEYLRLIEATRPMVIYAARRLRLARAEHDRNEAMQAGAKAARQFPRKIIGENRPSDARIEGTLVESLVIRLDTFAADIASQVQDVKQVDLLFDEIDVAERYEATIQRTREVSRNITTVKGWDPIQSKRVEGTMSLRVHHRVDTEFIGGIHVIGKAHPLVLAADIVTNHLAHHLQSLPPDAPLNAPSSVQGWLLQDRVWGVSDGATEDLF